MTGFGSSNMDFSPRRAVRNPSIRSSRALRAAVVGPIEVLESRTFLSAVNPFAGVESVSIDGPRPLVAAAEAPASISGIVFNDINADGVKNTGEGGLINRRVFIDAD